MKILNYLILVNKDNRLPKNYVSDDLVKVKGKYYKNNFVYLEKKTYKQIKKLLKDMSYDLGYKYIILSGYRPYLYESNLVRDLIRENGEDILKSIPLPSYSEHQTGLSLDIGVVIEDGIYKITEEYVEEIKWLDENAFKYGFIIRYPKDKEDITGYLYNPNHLRYIGDYAEFLKKYNLTLEEYYEMFVF